MKTALLFFVLMTLSIGLGNSLDKYTTIFQNRAMDKSYKKSSNLDAILNETSGLDFSLKRPELLYQINDSGNDPILYRTRLDGSIESSLKLDIGMHDFESITLAKCGDKNCIYIFDTGDNLHIRSSYSIYQITEQDYEAKHYKKLKRIDFSFPEGRRHDTEATAYNFQSNKLLLFTKGSKSIVFELNLEHKPRLKQVAKLEIYKATGAAYFRGYYYILNLNSIFKISEKDIYEGKQAEAYEKYATWQSEGLAINSENFIITSESISSFIPAKIMWSPCCEMKEKLTPIQRAAYKW